MDFKNFQDPAEVPPSPKAFVQYEENRRKETDQRDAVQKKTFTKWVNKHLLKAGRRIVDLFEGFKDGHNLLSLLEVLSHETLPRERGRMKFHQIQNVQIALEFLRRKGIRLVNIRSDEIVDGNPKLTLGLVWTIILHFQISDVVVPGQPEDITAKEALLLWSRRTTDGYPGVRVQDFTHSWRDGKAFLSVLHRNRPDCIDFRRVQTQTNRQNLELAFSTAEREFGVTRLLDPEDVDVPNPDEKSIITYVASLYDKFPDVPSVEQSLIDNERQLKLEEYGDLTVPLVAWLQDSAVMLSQRDFPTTLVEMKSLMSDLNRFKMEDVPPRLEMRKKLLKLFDEIQSSGTSHMPVSDEVLPDNVNRMWHRFEHALQEREMAIQSEIIRLDRLQRLAEKVHREARQSEEVLSDLERRVQEEERRVDTVHPFESKRSCEAIERALKNQEDMVRSMLRDAQALQDGRYAQAETIYRRVSALQTQVSHLKTEFYNKVLQKAISKSYVKEDITSTRRREVVTEVRLIESNPAFRHIQNCLNWIEEKQKVFEGLEFGSDLASIQANCEQQQHEHAEVLAFKKEIEKCIHARRNLSPEEQDLYTEWLSKVEVAYSLLNTASSRRLKSLESLLDFLQSATQELIWLNEKEEVEVTRDWSSSRLNVPSVDEFYKNLLQEMKTRESQFNSVQDRGNSMVLDRHPASKTIEAYMGEMQSQWSWLLQLSVCLEAHVRHTSAYYQFFEEASECEQWMSRQADSINIRYTDESQSVDTLQMLLKELQELSDHVADYERRVSSLAQHSREIIPLKLRGQPVFSEMRCRCLCIYKQPPMMLSKNEEVFLLDNSQKIRWRVRTLSGQEDLVPSVCILIPPPNYEAIEFADRLKIQLDHLQSLLKMRRRKLRHSMVLGTISLIQGWDPAQFQALDPARREALLRALNEDATKLIAEVGEGDREMRQLKDKLNECNQHFLSLTAAVNEQELRRSRGPDKEFLQKLDSVSYQLSSLDQDLQVRVQQPLPHDNPSLDTARRQQTDWERALQNQEGPVEQVRQAYNTLGTSSPQTDAKISFIDEKWEQLITQGNAHAERLRLLESTLTKLDSLRRFIADQEVALGSQEGMSSDPNALKAQQSDLQTIKTTLEKKQGQLDALMTDIKLLREVVEKGRPDTSRHHDLEDLEKRVEALTGRWTSVGEQVDDRLKSMNVAVETLDNYTNGYATEHQFVAQTQDKIDAQPNLNSDLNMAKQQLSPAMAIYNSLGEHQHQIEAVNRHGGQFIREAKIYEKKLQHYHDNLHQMESRLAEGLHKRPRKTSGAESVRNDLDALNRHYIDQVLWANNRLKDIKTVFSDNNIEIQLPMLVTDRVPLLRTFRAELTKRSSMLVDEDMQEYFQQLSEFEGYGGLQAMGKTGETFGSQTAINVTAMTRSSDSMAFSSAASTPQSPVVKWRMKTPPIPSHRLSNKVASITSLSGISTGSEDMMADLDGSEEANQTLITVRQGCLAAKGTQLNMSAILNPITGRKVTLVDAINSGVLDVKTATIMDARTNKRMSLSQAVTNRYISHDMNKQLNAPCGITDPISGSEFTLIEAIQKELFDPQNNAVKDPSTGKFIPLEEAVTRKLISDYDAQNILGEGVTVTFITQSQPLFTDKDLASTTMRMGLGDVIEDSLYIPKSGKIMDPFTGKELTVLEAVEIGFINPAKREIKDVKSGKMLTLLEAVTSGVIDPEAGRYINKTNGQKLTLDDAYQRKLINKPLMLPRALNENLVLDNGKVIDPQTGRIIPFKEALDTGVIDSDSKCIVDSSTGDVVSVVEAIRNGLLDKQGFVHPDRSSEKESLLDSVDKGQIKFVQEDLTFSKQCVMDTKSGKLLTVQQAIKQGVITSNGDFIDTSSGRRVLLKAASGQGFIDKSVVDSLLKDRSMTDSSGRNISLLKAIQIGLISPDTLKIHDPKSRKAMSLQQATTAGIISTEDAKIVMQVLCPSIAHTTVTTRLQPGAQEVGIRSISVSDAIARGLLNEANGTFRNPNTGAVMPVQTAIEQGMLRLSSEWPVSLDVADGAPKSPRLDVEKLMRQLSEDPTKTAELQKTGKTTVESKVMRKEGDKNYSFTQTVVTKPQISETIVSETKHFKIKSVVDPRTKLEIGVYEATHRGLLDMNKGLFVHPITDEKMSIEAALSRGFVRGVETSEQGPGTSTIKERKSFSLTGVIHPRTGERLPVSQAEKEGILDLQKGMYYGFDTKGQPLHLKISEAIERGFIVAEDGSRDAGPTGGLVHETKTYQLKSVINPLTKQKLDVAEAIKQGIIDEHKGLYINPRTGEKITIPDAIERKLIDAEIMSVVSNAEGGGSKIITTKMTTLMVKFVVDPRTGETITVSKALDEGILDSNMENYKNPLTGEVMTLNEAIDKKLVIAQAAVLDGSKSSSTESIHINPDEEVTESNLVEEVSSETVTFSINSVVDPRTMEMMSYDEAVLYGVLDIPRGLYVNPMTRETTPINIALEKGLIHGEVTAKSKSEDLIHSSVEASHLSFPVRQITSVIDPSDGKEISLDKAVKDKIIDIEKGTYFDVNTLECIPLEKAFDKGYIKLSKTTDAEEIERLKTESLRRESERERRHLSSENGIESHVDMKMEKFNVAVEDNKSPFAEEVFNYTTDVENKAHEPLTVHQQQGVRTWKQKEMAVVDTRSESPSDSEDEDENLEFNNGLSFLSSMKLGLIDAKTGKLRDPETGRFITINEAIDREILDQNKPAMKDILTGKTLTLKQCIDKGIIDPRSGKINEKKAKGEKVEVCPIIDAKQTKGKPLNLLDCVASGLYDHDTGMFTDPKTQNSYTLQEAVDLNLIDGNLVSVMDKQTGEKVTLADALRQGLIDGVTAEIVGPDSGDNTSLLQSVQQGLVENLFDKQAGTLFDTLTGNTVTLDKALTEGNIRSDEAKVLDTSTNEVVPLDVAFRKGLVDVNTGAVTDKITGKKLTPQEAIKMGLLAIVGAPVLATKAVYDAISDKVDKAEKATTQTYQRSPFDNKPYSSSQIEKTSPFEKSVPSPFDKPSSSPLEVKPSSPSWKPSGSPRATEARPHHVNGTSINGSSSLSATENYQEQIIEPRTTIVFAKPGDRIRPSPPTQLFPETNGHSGSPTDEYRSFERYTGLADSYDKLLQDLHNENNWVSDIEQLLKDDQPVSEEAYKAQAQTEALKALHEDVLRHQQPIRSLVYQSEQLVEHHQEELTPEQVTELQNLESIIKVAFGKIQKTCESRMKHLTAATEELGKFEGELQKFVKWLETTDKELERQMDVVHDYDSIRRVTEQHKEMMSDIVAHGADLRLLSFAVSKYMEEAKCHKLELDAYKADRVKPSRLSRTSWIAMDNKEVELVREKQKDAENQYKELKNQCSNFGEKLNQLANKQKEFNDTTWTMLSWLTDAEEKLSMIRQEASAPEPAALREHLEKMRALGNDAIAHKNQLADLEKSGREVSGQMRELDIGGEQVEKIQEIINDISGRHKIVCEEINERANDLQTAVTKSQNVQDAMDQLLGWLKDTDRKLDQQKPISLNQDKLSEQAKQLSILETDIDSHKPSIESVKQSANELIKTCDIDMAKTLEGKIADIGSKFLDAQKKCRATSKDVSEVSDKLDKFNEQSEALKGWIQTNTDTLSSSDWNRRPIDQLKEKVDDVTMEKERQLSAMEGVQSLGRELIEDPRTGDTAMVKMSLGNLDDSWSKFDECLSERNAETSIKESREQEYDAIKQEVVQWLTRMEGDVDGFEPVAVDMDVVAKQIEELQPMIQEYYEFSPKIDELNEVGTAYDAIQSGDSRPKSPMRFRSRRHPSSILSPRLRSPSPTMGNFSFGAPPGDSITSPMSMSSDSSGVGSRKSSSDFLQVDDLSETQQDILDMTQRYEMLEERLLDRQHELQGMLGSVKSFLQDLADILSWLDIKEKDLGDAVAVATSEKEAKRRLKEHEHAHAELLSKESLVDEIRRKGQDLMKRKRGVPGTELVQEQLSELDDKWLGVKVSSEQQRKLLEDIVTDLRTYKDAGVHLQKWIAQKEKMVAVLGPVATDPSMVKNQLEQVKVLQEEMKGQEPLYDKFIHSGNAVHDKCTPDSKDASHISEKMTVISKSWERLSDKLREREKSLSSVEGLSLEFSDTLQGLSNWMSDYMTTIDNLSPVATSPEKNLEHQREIKELERELKQKVPILEKAKDLAKKLADTTKDANTKFELKNKISGLEKPMTEAERKLTARSNEVLKASEEGDRFKAGCHELLDRVKELKRKQAEATPVSGDPSILRQQAQQNKDLLKDLNDLLPEIKAAEEKAKQFGPGSSSTTRALLDIIDTVQAEYQTLQQAAAKREEQLETSTIHNQNFQAELDKMLLWLQLYEEKLDGLSPSSIDQDAVGKKLKEAQGLRGDVLKFSYDQELLNREGQALMQAVDSDKGTIKVRLADINQRWDNLNEGLGERIQSLEDISGKLTEVEDCSTDLDNSLKKLEEKLDAHNKLGSSAKDPKHQDKIRTLQDDTSALDTQLSYMDSLLKSLDECDGALPAQKQVEVQRARDRQANLQAQLADLLQDMEAGTQFVDQFQGTVKNAGAKVTELEAELLNMAPVARDESSLKGQERQIEEFISRLNDLDNFIEELNDQYKTLKTDGYVTTADGLAAQLDMLQGQQERLREDSDNRKKDITETANRLEAVTDNLRRMRTSIDRAGDELEMHEPIGSDVNAIKRLQDELKRMKQFQHGVLENLARRVQAVTSDAQSLIQTAASGVDTSGLETDQESLMDKWNSLNSKVSERDRNLDNAILQSGKFNDALRNLLEWLSETEDLVANQKSPSPDYKVAKAQLQEQKFLLKMLDDRAPSVKSVQDSGMSLQNNLEDRERKAIQNQVGQLDQRWSELNTRAQDRANTLENIIVVAQQFQETREPLIGWLDQVEKKFTSLEPTALDAGGIENIIVALKDMEKDLKSKDEDIKKLASTGKQLQNQCKGEDVKNVQRKIDDVQSRFGELSDKITDTQEQMEEALPLAKSFNDSHAKFVDWIVKMEPKTRHKEGNETEDQVQELLDNVKDVEPVLAAMKTDGNQLSELVPGDAGFKVLDTLSKDMKRFEVVNEAIQNKADKFRASKLKSAEMMFALDDLLEWFKDEESLITNCDHISCDPAKLQKQLADQKAMNDDINAEKAKARDIIAMGKRLAREGSIENEQELFGRLEQLKQSTDKVTKMASDRLVQLEQALPLSRTFLDAHQDLLAWFEEVTPAIAELEVMSINQDTVKKQQDKVKVLKQDLQDNKPLIDKLNKAGLALTKLDMTPVDQDQVKRTMDEDNKLIDDIRRAVRDRSMSIDEALQQSAEFTDKLENMLETLTTTEEMVSNATPVAAHPDKLREQIADNNALMEEMQMRLTALESVQTAAEDLIKQASDSQDDAVKDVKLKLRDLVDLYEKIGDGLTDRGNQLEETLEVSDKFWDDLHGLTRTLKDLSDTLSNQEPPALEPALIREQQDTLESIRDDIEASQFDLDEVHQTGEHLLTLCGEPDKPEVQKNIDDLDTSLLQITGDFDKRFRSLEEALEKSTHFQDQLMKTLVWLQKREDRLKELGPVSADFDKVKSQWNEIKLFKSDVDPKHADIEALNQKADELVKGSSPDQEMVVRDPITQVNKRWDGLQESISDRQRMLQLAMLNAGQFDHAMNELLTWLDKTDQMLDEATPVYGDRKLVEIELAKHKVLQNDIIAHDQSVRKVKEAGQRAVTEEGGIRSSTTRRKMDELTELWHKVQDKSASKQKKLEAALSEAKTFNGDMEKMLTKLGQIEGMLITSLPVGGMPETAREQLERFMEVHKELQDLEPTISKLQGAGQQLMQKSNDPAASNIKQNLQVLQQTWEHCKTRAGERKGKLEQAVNQANNFHADLNHFIGWLTDTEKILNNMKPVSRVITHVTEQIKDHTALQKDIKVQRDTMIKLDKLGTHLKYFSQKQDVVLIKNLLASVQQRWEKIVSRSAERTRFLERGFKEAKQFNDMLNDLLTWLADSDQLLTTEFTVGNDPIKIKAQIAKHKEFQKILGSKQPVYDNVNRAGRTLKERSPEEDVPIIQEMLHELKNKWNAVCGKSVDRQRKLEEALLFSGQFNDALDALLDWLAKVEPGLGEDQMVHGDIDTVNNLVEEHKAFQQELGARSNNVAFVRKRARELMDKSEEDTSQQQAQMIELSSMWDRVCKLSVNKQDRLEQAHKLADDFHKKAHDLITWLAQGERQLRYKGPLPDDEGEIIKQIEEHKHFEEEFLRQEANLRETLNIGQDIMKRCHPDAVSTLKHWLSVLKARWEEVSNWSRQRGSRLRDGLATLRRNNQLLEELIAWLNGAETRLYNDNAEPIPEDVDCIQTLIKEHMDFQNEMSGKQPEIDQVTKGDRRRGMSMSGEPVSNIPILKSLSGRRTPTPSKYGSLRRGGRDDDGRRTPEPHFKNPRVGALHNKWRQVWLVSMDRQRRLQDALDYMQEFERMKDFKFDDWRKRYLTWMHHNKSRIMDFFRRQDRDRDGKVTRTEFIQGIMNSKFNTSPMEMEAVANIFDRDGDGYIDYKEFVSALRPNRDTKTSSSNAKPEPVNESELIQDEVKRQVHKCTCVKQYRIHKIGEGKYRFGDSQKLRLVRILRSTVMVRVGGGWMALDEFLVKNDPCRAKGKTNVELREQFTLASGVSQSMAGFVSKSPSGSSYSGSSTYSGATSPWSARSPSTTSGPVIRVREKAAYSTPWRQNMARYHPDGEVNQIMSTPRRVGRDSPRHFQSPATPVSRSSSRASTGSRPFSPTGSETSEISEPEVFTTVQSETRNIGGRNETTRTYQTHVVTNRTVNTPSRQTTATPTRQSASTPTRLSTSTPTRMSKIPKLTPKKR